MRTLSLFTGAGGLDIGFHHAGFNILGCVEIDQPSCETLEKNVGVHVDAETKIFNCDITKTEPSDLGIEDVDFIIGGPPCQSFSAAGRRAGGVHGINDTRGSLFWYYCKYLEYFKPRGFLFENVKGILQANKKSDWDIIQKSFESVGYRLYYGVLDAADYGTPQHRERLIMVGVREDLDNNFLFPMPTYGPGSVNERAYITPKEALSDIYNPGEEVKPYGGKYGHLLADIPPGSNYLFYTEKMGHPSPLFAWRSKFSGFLYKLPMDAPSKTIVAHQGKYDGPFHWNNRKLTIEELKRIQGFPDDYRFVDSKNEAVKQIGNSVAPRMAAVLAEAVKAQLFGFESEIALTDLAQFEHMSKRKAAKAAKTKLTVKPNKGVSLSQLSLLEEDKKFSLTLSRSEIVEIDGEQYKYEASLLDGQWRIFLSNTSSQSTSTFSIELDFSTSVGCEFKHIYAEADLVSVLELHILWDLIHSAVDESSSYEGLLPLYGHFTEPYPKFRLKFHANREQAVGRDESLYLEVISNMMDFDYLSKIHNYDAVFRSHDEADRVIQKLRSVGFDIRTHETNRAIKEGCFKPCYPFSLYSKVNSYIAWIQKGAHRTGDVKTSLKDGRVSIELSVS
jgi:DNA (cytosine-5)-methyltransferase 1